VKVEKQAGAKERRASEARRALYTLAVVLLAGIAAYICFDRFYLVREWLLVVALTALLVFLAANLAVLGLVVHAAGRMILGLVRKAQPRIVVAKELLSDAIQMRSDIPRRLAQQRGVAARELRAGPRFGPSRWREADLTFREEFKKARSNMGLRLLPLFILCMVLAGALPLSAQQKPQWMPGQEGLNAGVFPSPGFTYVNMEINYDTSTINNSSGKGCSCGGALAEPLDGRVRHGR